MRKVGEPRPLEVSTSGLVGGSASMRKVHAMIEKVSRYAANVLLLGESGTGKELIARALHNHGPRKTRLFVPINCATLGKDLLENELFGHERGAFTGATETKKGLLEIAHGGTLFLDEIGEMDSSTQAKMLRVIERSEFRRVGGNVKIKVDVSIVAATNSDLHAAMAAGRFRKDLFYRLKVVTIAVPPLRDRREDIPALVDTFIGDFNRQHDGKIIGIAPQAMKMLMDHDWPGNVRELKNVIASAAMLSEGILEDDVVADAIDMRGSGASNAQGRPPVASELDVNVGMTLAEAERRLILATVDTARSRSHAAAMLGIGVRTLYTKLAAYEPR